MKEESSLKKLIRYKKYKEVFNLKSKEVIISILGTIIILFVTYLVIQDTNLEDINIFIRDITKELALVLIGYLGFVVSGLAILTSSISNKIMNIFNKKNKIYVIERILLSFYLLGILIGITIFLGFLLNIITYSNKELSVMLFLMCEGILSYLILFIIFYSIELIGNCIEIFKIINLINDNDISSVSKSNKLTESDMIKYNNIRITALEMVILSDKEEPLDKIKLYYNTLNNLKDNTCDSEEQ